MQDISEIMGSQPTANLTELDNLFNKQDDHDHSNDQLL